MHLFSTGGRDMFKSFFASKEYFWKARGVGFLLIGLIISQAVLGRLLADWGKEFGNLMQEAIKWQGHHLESNQEFVDKYWDLVRGWLLIVGPNVVIGTCIVLIGGLYIASWREAINRNYLPRWIAIAQRTSIVGAAQRIQEDTQSIAKTMEDFGLAIVQSLCVLAVFGPRLWALSEGPAASLFSIAAWTAVAATIGAILLGWGLPRLENEHQIKEQSYRSGLVLVEKREKEKPTIDILFQEFHGALGKYRELIKKSFVLSLWTNTYSFTMSSFPGLLMTNILITGMATMGDINEVASVFGQVSGALSIFAYRWRNIIDIWSIILRLRKFQKDLELAEKTSKEEQTWVDDEEELPDEIADIRPLLEAKRKKEKK